MGRTPSGYQVRDGMVVSGDSDVRTFAGVGKVVVDAGSGNDDISIVLAPPVAARRASIPSPLAPGVKVEVHAGSGNDVVRIEDGEASKRLHLELARQTTVVVDLGTGSDTLRAPLNNHRDVSLDVLSADGGDHVEAPISISVCNPPGGNLQVKCALRASLELGGGGNTVDLQPRGFDSLDVSVSAAADSEPVDPSGNTIYVSADAGGVWKNSMPCDTDDCRTADISIDLRGPGGDTVDVAVDDYPDVHYSFTADPRPTGSIGVSPSSLSFTATAGGSGIGTCRTYCVTFGGSLGGSSTPGGLDSSWLDFSFPVRRSAALDAQLHLGAGADRVALATQGVDEVAVAVEAGAGDDTVEIHSESTNSPRVATRSEIVVDMGDGNDAAIIHTTGLLTDRLDMAAGSGNDAADVDSFYGRGVYKSTDSGQTWQIDMGTGDDRFTARSDGYANVDYSIAAGDGDDTVEVADRLSPFYRFDSKRLVHRIDLGSGADRLSIDADGFGAVSSLIDAGAGDDIVEARHVRHRLFALIDRTQLIATVRLGPGSDSLALETTDASRIQTAVDTGPVGDGHDVVTATHDSLSRSNRVSTDVVNFALDGGLDIYRHSARGYTANEVSRTIVGVEWVFVT
jgi:hypothetical protein